MRLRSAAEGVGTTARIDEIQIDLGEGPSWEALRTRRPVAAADLRAQGGARWPGACAALLELEVGSLYAFPPFVGTVSIGSIGIYSAGARDLSDSDLAGMSGLAAIVSVTLLRRALDRLEVLVEESELAQAQLQRALDSRVVIEQAKGYLAQRHNIDMDQAFARIRSHARSTQARIGVVAADIIAGRLVF